MLLVHDDEPQAVNGREDRGARADDHGCCSRGDALPLVAPLGVAESRVQDRDAVAEARAEAPDGLGRERDLRDEHDDASVTREGGRGSLEVDLGLAAAGRPMEENVRAACVECRNDPLDGRPLSGRKRLGLGLASERLATRGVTSWPAPDPSVWSDERQRTGGCRTVVVREPERELDQRGRDRVDDVAGVGDVDSHRRHDIRLDDDAPQLASAESDRQDVALPHVVRHPVRERPRKRTGSDERVDLRERHAGERSRAPACGRYAVATRFGLRKKK